MLVMPGQYYPVNDQEFEAWVANFIANLTPLLIPLGEAATFDDDIIARKATYSTTLTSHVSAQTASFNARQAKDTSKESLINSLRFVVNQLRINPAFTDAMTVSLGLPLRDLVPSPSAPGSEIPTMTVDNSAPQTHIIRFWQMTEDAAERAAKPEWARALRIVRSVVESGQPCPAIELMGWLASDTSEPYMVLYNGTAVGKDAYYRGSWETQGGEIGLWSEAVKATITG